MILPRSCRSGLVPLEQSEVNSNGVRNQPFGMKLRIAIQVSQLRQFST